MTFDEAIPIIDREIAKRAGRWQLSSICWLDYQDVAQIIRIHIHKKFYQYDQSRPLAPWVNKIISCQMINLVRNLYGNYSRPCNSCEDNQGNNLCAQFGVQCNTCPLYAKWERTRKRAHDVKLTLPLENHQQEVHNIMSDQLDIRKAATQLHTKMRLILKPVEWKVYKHLYVLQLEEDTLVKELGFKTSEQGRMAGYRQLFSLKKSIMEKVRKILGDGDIDFI